MIYVSVDELNEALEASGADFSRIRVLQMSISDYSKAEMEVIVDILIETRKGVALSYTNEKIAV